MEELRSFIRKSQTRQLYRYVDNLSIPIAQLKWSSQFLRLVKLAPPVGIVVDALVTGKLTIVYSPTKRS